MFRNTEEKEIVDLGLDWVNLDLILSERSKIWEII